MNQSDGRRASRRTLIWIVAILILAFVVLFALSVVSFGERIGGSAVSLGRQERQTVAVAGDQSRFDPVAAYAQVMAFAGPGARLESLRATGVRRDGTMDLTATYSPAPHVTYELHREAPAPDPAPPVGAGGSADGRWFQSLRVDAYRAGQERQVTRTGNGVGLTYRYINRGLDLDEGSVSGAPDKPVAPPPACSFARLWEDAVAQGAPADAVAQISYDMNGYRFNIPGVFNRRYAMDCTPTR